MSVRTLRDVEQEAAPASMPVPVSLIWLAVAIIGFSVVTFGVLLAKWAVWLWAAL